MTTTFSLLGLPNSGKSSIIRALNINAKPIINEEEGTTRDFVKYKLKFGHDNYICDTAGYTKDFLYNYKHHLEKTDSFLFVFDGSGAVTKEHKIFIDTLRKLFPKKMTNALLIINKIDKLKKTGIDYEYISSLGFNQFIEISAVQKSNMRELINYLYDHCDESKKPDLTLLPEENEIKKTKISIAILGKSNVGKSSLMNVLSCEKISIVDEKPNTTVDPIENEISIYKEDFVLYDTAGFSKEQKLKYEGELIKRTKEILNQCDIAIIMTDADRGVTKTDLDLFGLCKMQKKAFLVVINKSDLLNEDQKKHYLQGKFQYHDLLSVKYISCKEGKGIQDLKKNILSLSEALRKKISTKELNYWAQNDLNYRNLSLKIKYITQIKSCPPCFSVNMNFKNSSFISFLQKSIRVKFYDNINVPIIIKLIR